MGLNNLRVLACSLTASLSCCIRYLNRSPSVSLPSLSLSLSLIHVSFTVKMPSKLDMTEVRGSFPALTGDQVFFDNAGGSQTLSTVVDRYA